MNSADILTASYKEELVKLHVKAMKWLVKGVHPQSNAMKMLEAQAELMLKELFDALKAIGSEPENHDFKPFIQSVHKEAQRQLINMGIVPRNN